MIIDSLKEAKRAADESQDAVRALDSYLDGVSALIDAASDVVGAAEEFDHPDHGKGFFVPAQEIDTLRRNVTAIE